MTSDPVLPPPPRRPAPALGWAVAAFVAAFGLLLASFPARNSDLWQHLADGRRVIRDAAAGVGPTWLYDLASYAVFRVAGGAALAAAKALAVAAAAVVTVRTSRTTGGWLVPTACTVLAVLAMSTRVLLQPATVSVLFLALTLWLLRREEKPDGVWPGWRLAVLFAVWANVDRWFVLGLGVTGLVWVGRAIDGRSAACPGRLLLRRAGSLAVLAAVTAVNPAHLTGFPLPAELAWADAARPDLRPVNSPFEEAYLSALGDSPAELAYYPLLGLGLASFLVAPRWRWGRFLPWLAVAVLSAFQVRTVPFFAVVAGPVLAWNLQDFFARRPNPGGSWGDRPAGRIVARSTAAVLAGAFLACAWPGWLQRPPFEPRRWVVERPEALERAAAAVRRWHADGVLPPGTRTLHLSPETAHAFAWFCPEDDGLLDGRLAEDVAEGHDTDGRLRAAGVTRLVLHAADRGLARAVSARLLADPDRWPLLHLDGGVVVFGRRDDDRAGPDPFRGREVDFDRMAFRPADDKKAPPARPGPEAERRRWWDVFWKPAPPPRSADRDDAAFLLLKADVQERAAAPRHLAEWEACQAAALAAAAGSWGGAGGPADAALRLTLFRPPVPGAGAPPPPITRLVFVSQQGFVLGRDDVPPAVLYPAVRAARRAVAANPSDAVAHLTLGRAYLRLLTSTRERAWALRFPQLARFRGVQAITALNRAVALNPALSEAHRELGRLYRELGLLDLALNHLRTYRDSLARADRGSVPAADPDFDRLAAVVDAQQREFAGESSRARIADRAAMAVARGLVGQARDLLLESDVAAFGMQGMRLELELLLQTGRAEDVLNWTTPELKESLGAFSYHWLRAQAYSAVGEYAAADAELDELTGHDSGPDAVRAAKRCGRLVGQVLLNEQLGGSFLPHVVWRAVGRSEFRSGLLDLTRVLAQQADTLVMRGLLALEQGEVDRAGESFRSALAFSPGGSGGGLEFGGRPIARECLVWIDAP